MEAVVEKNQKLKKGEVSNLWWNGPNETHAREIQCRDSLPGKTARDSYPIAEGGFGRPVVS
jgi:hypothetical protein